MAVKREKVVRTAEKYVQRGKITSAIKEYRKLLEEFPDDATTLNRLGDLYARIEQNDEAIGLFTQIAENYTADGFFPKATAIYKKIIKLDPTRLEVYEQLAELYHRQGLLNEARTQYQVLADYYLKHDNSSSALAIYERMAEVDPEDPSLRVRLAELYQEQKLLDKAMAQYREIAGLMLGHGHAEEAEQVLLKGLDIDPEDEGFITDGVLRLKEAGAVAAAARFLSAAVERNPEMERVARVVGVERAAPSGTGGDEETEEPAEAAAPPPAQDETPPAEPEPASPAAEEADADLVLDVEGMDEGLEDLDDLDIDGGLDLEPAAEPEAATESTAESAAESTETEPAVPDLSDAPSEAGEITLDLTGVFELDLEDEELPGSRVEPPEEATAEEEVEETLQEPAAGLESAAPAAEAAEVAGPEPAPSVPPGDAEEALERTPPPGEIDADYLERTAAELDPERIQQEEDLVTEAEVLLKYGLTEKAMERLGELLALNPDHPDGTALLIRLHLEEGEPAGAAELATRLLQHAPRSDAWSDVWPRLEAGGFERSDDGRVIPPEGELPAVAEDAVAEETAAMPPPDVAEPAGPVAEMGGELEVSDPSMAEGVDAEPEAQEPPAEERRPAGRRRESDVDDMLASLTAEVLPGKRRRPSPPKQPEAPPPAAAAEPPSPPASEAAEAETVEPGTEWLQDAGVETEGGGLFDEEEDFFDLAAELEEELSQEGELGEEDLLLEQPQEQSLEQIVEGFKKGVSENLSEEDHQTHYDLGIAYREMGLLDEAVGEFQIAAKSPDLLVDCCSMLGLSFLEKGLPELAVKWYRRGLEAPALGEEDQLGLLYDLGCAYQALGDRDQAHATFVEIYGTNSNYRDIVAKLEETRLA